MSKKRKIISLAVLGVLLLASLALSLLLGKGGAKESLQTIMRDAVLHEDNKISLFGLMDVNPAVVSGFIVTGVLLVLAALARIFVIPRFKYKPGKLQLLLEELVTFFQNLAQTNSPHRNGFLGAYLFGAGVYVLFGTLFELFGLQAVTTAGGSISLPAPLSDINAAISVGCMSYLVILGGGIAANKLRGAANTLKDFSLPISMSFRLFGALLSGLLVTELVYYSLSLSFVLPVFVGVMFTLLHALIQTYVLTTLVSIFYGEVTEPHNKKSSRPLDEWRNRKMKLTAKRMVSLMLVMLLVCTLLAVSASAADTADAAPAAEAAAAAENSTGAKAIAAAVVVGLVATAGALGMAIAIGKSAEGMSRQPEASGSIRSSMMLGLVFIETAIIYALIVAILIIFVL